MSFFGTSSGGGAGVTITNTYVVASQAAMLALSADTGDIAIRTDVSKSFILKGSSPSTLADWEELLTPPDSVTSVNGQTGTVSLNTSHISENTNLYYTTARANTDFDSRLATKSTSNLSEGSNLYYTSGRANSDFDTRLALKSTSDLAEGSNLYYTTARVNSAFDTRLALKSTSDLAEGSNLYYTSARFNSAFSGKSTSDLSEGTNLYYTSARFNSAFSGKSTSDLAEGTNLYFTEARVRASVLTGFSSGAGTVSASDSVLSAINKLDGNISGKASTTLNNLGTTAINASLLFSSDGSFDIGASGATRPGNIYAKGKIVVGNVSPTGGAGAGSIDFGATTSSYINASGTLMNFVVANGAYLQVEGGTPRAIIMNGSSLYAATDGATANIFSTIGRALPYNTTASVKRPHSIDASNKLRVGGDGTNGVLYGGALSVAAPANYGASNHLTTTSASGTTITVTATNGSVPFSIGIGDYISVNSVVARVTAISGSSVTVDSALGTGTTQTVFIVPPIASFRDNTGAEKVLIDKDGKTYFTSTMQNSALTASKVMVTDGSKNLSSSSVAATDIFTPVVAKATNSSTTISGSPTVLVWGTEEIDSASASTLTSNGKFTAPSAGIYEIHAQVMVQATFALNDELDIRVMKNGSQKGTSTCRAHTSQGSMWVQVTDILQLAANDEITVEVASGGTSPALASSNEYNRVHIKKISN